MTGVDRVGVSLMSASLQSTVRPRAILRFVFLAFAMASVPAAAFAQARKEFRQYIAPGGTVSLSNSDGSVTVHPGAGRQVVIQVSLPAGVLDAEVHPVGNRIQVHTHILKATNDHPKADYDISIPPDVSISIDLGIGSVQVENLRNDVHIDVDDGSVEVRGIGNGTVHVQTMNGLVTLADIQNCHVQVTSSGGNVVMDSVTGPSVSVKAVNGNIRYFGDFAGGGSYRFVNNGGDIEVRLPRTASVDLTANSVKGSVENDFPFRAAQHTSFVPKTGRSFTGTSLTGASAVELRSFSGTIRVKKQ